MRRREEARPQPVRGEDRLGHHGGGALPLAARDVDRQERSLGVAEADEPLATRSSRNPQQPKAWPAPLDPGLGQADTSLACCAKPARRWFFERSRCRPRPSNSRRPASRPPAGLRGPRASCSSPRSRRPCAVGRAPRMPRGVVAGTYRAANRRVWADGPPRRPCRRGHLHRSVDRVGVHADDLLLRRLDGALVAERGLLDLALEESALDPGDHSTELASMRSK